jgi:hypothetical protein
MHDALAMRFVQSIGNFCAVAKHLVNGEWPFRDSLVERFSLDILEHQEIDAILLADVVQRADVGMLQARNGACLTFKALAQLWLGGYLLRKNLYGDNPVQSRIARAVDLSHATSTDGGNDFIGAELGAGNQGHDWSAIIYRKSEAGSKRRRDRDEC